MGASESRNEAVEELASLQFSPEDVAIIAEFDATEFDTDEVLAAAYMRGRLKAQGEVRRAVLQMAKQGSTPAQKQFMQLIEDDAASGHSR